MITIQNLDVLFTLNNNYPDLKQKGLQLEFSQNSLTDPNIYSIANALKILECKSIYLELNNNNITNQGACHLAKLLIKNNCQHISIVLKNNKIGEEGVKYFLAALQHPECSAFVLLDLGHNQIGTAGAKAILELFQKNQDLPNDTLKNKFIILRDREYGKEMQAIAQELADTNSRCPTGLQLNIENTNFSIESVSDFVGKIITNNNYPAGLQINLHCGELPDQLAPIIVPLFKIKNNQVAININFRFSIMSEYFSEIFFNTLKELNKSSYPTICFSNLILTKKGAERFQQALVSNITVTQLEHLIVTLTAQSGSFSLFEITKGDIKHNSDDLGLNKTATDIRELVVRNKRIHNLLTEQYPLYRSIIPTLLDPLNRHNNPSSTPLPLKWLTTLSIFNNNNNEEITAEKRQITNISSSQLPEELVALYGTLGEIQAVLNSPPLSDNTAAQRRDDKLYNDTNRRITQETKRHRW